MGKENSMLLSELKGSISEAEGERLKYLASLSSHNIVEIGSYYGKSTCYLASGASDDIKVYAIDLWNFREITSNAKVIKNKKPGNSAFNYSVIVKFNFKDDGSGNIAQRILLDTWNIFKEQVQYTGNKNKIIPIKANSNEVAKLWNKNISLLFIDGDHRYKQCLADYNNFAPFVVKNGYVAFHDYNTIRNYGVKKVVDEIIKTSKEWVDWTITESLITGRRT
jgi:cephalosporin hydroxylase